MRSIWQLDDQLWFPPAHEALEEPNGLLAVGGDLSPARLIKAYRQGIFPWFSEQDPILWWSPAPRMVLIPHQIRIRRSLRKVLRHGHFNITFDQAFEDVIHQCGALRQDREGTWITAPMKAAYCQLHQQGYAHSVECWQEGALVGGLYGIALGRVFFGESMFSQATDASKVALASLCYHLDQCGYQLIDCQVHSDHLERLGAQEIDRTLFLDYLSQEAHEGTQSAWITPSNFVGVPDQFPS